MHEIYTYPLLALRIQRQDNAMLKLHMRTDRKSLSHLLLALGAFYLFAFNPNTFHCLC